MLLTLRSKRLDVATTIRLPSPPKPEPCLQVLLRLGHLTARDEFVHRPLGGLGARNTLPLAEAREGLDLSIGELHNGPRGVIIACRYAAHQARLPPHLTTRSSERAVQ